MRLLLVVLVFFSAIAKAQTPGEWIRLGEQVHGGFGTLIPLGIRIGLDARERLKAAPRELDVTYLDGAGTPCACVADGILIATRASPGQSSLRVSADKAPAGFAAEVLIMHRTTGEQLRYRIPAAAYGKILQWNKGTTPAERYKLVMEGETPFQVEMIK